ncbi:MAG: phytoene desaturase family protein [Paracoccaceae bacterium]
MKRWHADFQPIVQDILIPESLSPPLPPEQRRALLERTAEGRLLLKVSALSPLEFVTREFSNPTIQAGLQFFNGLREVDLRLKGFGHHIASLLARPSKAQMTVGGSASLARALEAAVANSGGTILTGTEPKQILVEQGRAIGVETADGATFRARHFVASGLNPHQTFLDLIDPDHLPAEWRAKVDAFQYNLIAPLFALNLNLQNPPRYAAAEKDPALDQAFMTIIGLERFDQFPEIVRHHEAGTIPPTVMLGVYTNNI